MAVFFRGQTPVGFSGNKDLNIRKVRYGPRVEAFAASIEADRDESIRLAIKHLTLKEVYPVITLPESIMLDWLESRRIDFVYQAITNVRSTPDFLILITATAVLVNGLYFHTIPDARREDRREVQALPGALSDGIQIRNAVRVWEPDILGGNRDIYFRAAVRGDEIRSIHERNERG